MAITPEQARAELARRELSRRQALKVNSETESQDGEKGFFSKLPRNIAVGLANLGHSTLNMPHDIAQGLENSGQDIGNAFNKGLPIPKGYEEKLEQLAQHKPFKLSEHVPFQQEHDFAQMLGQHGEGTLMDKLIQKGVQYSPEMLYGGGLLKNAGLNAIKMAPRIAEKAGDLLPIVKRIASKPYVKQMKILEEKGLLSGYNPNTSDVLEASRILRSKGMKIPHEAVNEAVAQTLEGNYKPWFNLQSSIRKEARRLIGMGGVNATLGEKLHALAEKMHTEIGEAQAARGAPEAEALMHQGKARFAKYHKISPASKVAGGVAVAATMPKWIAQMIKGLSK
jgi:hypothetical protein